MYQQHPDSEDLEHFLQNTSRSAASAKKDFLVRHLLAECATCREHLNEIGWNNSRLERLLSLPSSDEMASEPAETSYDYSQAFSKIDRKIEEFLATDLPLEQPLEDLLSELQAYPENEQRRRVQGESR